MRKVAVSVSNGDNIEKIAPIIAGAAKFAAGALARGAASKTGKLALAGKLLGGGDDDDKKPNIAGAVANTMQQQAEARKQRQQNQIQNNMQMADRAKNNAQISTGKPMDMSWRLLKNQFKLNEDFESLREEALEGRKAGWKGKKEWDKMKPIISEEYGDEPIPGASWKKVFDVEGFDPHDESNEIDGDNALPLHFSNQLKRIPMLNKPTAKKILQMALNTGQGLADGSVTKPYSLSDFVDFNDAEIATGKPMDMSWRLLKDWSWNSEIEPRTRQAIIERARKAKKKQKHSHISSVPSRHHDDQFNLRYHPHQKMPIGAEGLEPHEIAAAMADMYLENHPELKQALHEELPQPADPNSTNTPGMVFHALNTNNPKTVGNTRWTSYSPVVAKPAMLDQIKLHSAIDTPAGSASNRHTIRVSSMRDYSHTYNGHNDTLPSKFNLSVPLTDLPTGGKEAQDLRQQYRIRQIGAGEEKWRNKILNVEGEKSDEIEQNLISRLHNEAMLSEQENAKAAKNFKAQQAREQQLAAREQGELKVELVHPAMPGLYSVTDPAFGIVGETYDASMPRYEYYHNHFLNQQNNVQTGEPMDLAWRMLKQMSDKEMQEWAYENLRNQGIVIPDEREEEIVPKPKIPTLYY